MRYPYRFLFAFPFKILQNSILLFFISGLSFAADSPPSDSRAIASPQCNIFTFDATKSYDHNKPLAYVWNFGDGETSSDAVVEHAYKTSGEYTVTLSVNDNSDLHCSIAQTTETIHVNFPPKPILFAFEKICVNAEALFDGSRSSDDTVNDLSYSWSLGDGTTERGKNKIKKKYGKPGNYTIGLTVDDKKTSCNTATATHQLFVNAAPVAQAGGEEFQKCVAHEADMLISFDASETTDGNNDDLHYDWDFGDGHSGQGIRVEHQFRESGVYDVKLVVRDPHGLGCSSDVDFVRVRLNKSPSARAGEDIQACTGAPVYFDGSASDIPQRGTSTIGWEFGDGTTSNSLKTSHVYNKAGVYMSILKVKNELNEKCPTSEDQRVISINAGPRAVLKVKPKGCVGEVIVFDASESMDENNSELEFYWNFGDGRIEQGSAKMEHTYAKGGTYTASVIVDDGLKTDCSSTEATATLTVNTAPKVNSGPNLTCCANQTADFDASLTIDPDGDTLLFHWDFGDGTKAEGSKAQHAYKDRGTYKIKLTVDDQKKTACSESSTEFDAEVRTGPTPVITVR